MNTMEWVFNERAREHGDAWDIGSCAFLNEAEAEKVLAFHRTIPGYLPTPLASLDGLATRLGLGAVYVKDESHRFGLKAFKVLGGSYAMARYLAKRLNRPIEELPYHTLTSADVRQALGPVTFCTATDGNHGRGVAWTARRFGQKAVVYMPGGSAVQRLENIRAEGAEAFILGMNYDDTVRFAAGQAREHGWVTVQDTVWEGYDEIPRWIMQGYMTMAREALDQMAQSGVEKPTHLFLQAGVGSMAASVQGHFTCLFGKERPVTLVVEPHGANCMFRSAAAGDGLPRRVEGNLETIMAGLACGEPNPAAWRILWDFTDAFLSCEDGVAAMGMRLLGNPLGKDPRIVSGESGAVTAGVLRLLMEDRGLRDLREGLGLKEDSVVLLFSTEGDTDPARYRAVVWDGEYPLTSSPP